MRYISERLVGLQAGDIVAVRPNASCRQTVITITALDVAEDSTDRFIASADATFRENAGISVELMQRGERVFA